MHDGSVTTRTSEIAPPRGHRQSVPARHMGPWLEVTSTNLFREIWSLSLDHQRNCLVVVAQS